MSISQRFTYLFEGIMEVVSEKKAGIEVGCIMQAVTDTQHHAKYMVKQMNYDAIIAEYIGSRLTRFIIEQTENSEFAEMVPLVDIITDRNNQLYIRSKYIQDYMSLDDYRALNHIPLACYPNGCNQDKTSQKLIVTFEQQNQLNTNFQVSQAASLNIYSDLVVHGDHHGVNRGVTVNEHGVRSAILDFSMSLVNSDKITYYNSNYHLDELINALSKVVAIKPEFILNHTKALFAELQEKLPNHNFNYHHQKVIKIINNRLKIFKQEAENLTLFKKLLLTVNEAEQHDIAKLAVINVKDLISHQINDLRGTDVNIVPIKMNLIEALFKISPPQKSEIYNYFSSIPEALPFIGEGYNG